MHRVDGLLKGDIYEMSLFFCSDAVAALSSDRGVGDDG